MTKKSLRQTGKRFRNVGSILLLITLALGPMASAFAGTTAQEITGGIRGEVKDQNGAVVPGAIVTASSAQRSYTSKTDDGGAYSFSALPPGIYTVTANATGFGGVKREDISVELGRVLQVNMELKAVAAGEIVTVMASQEPIVDVTSTKTATNVTRETFDVLPKGLNFTSAVNMAPGSRNEPKNNGFQIDGASGSENNFIVDGLDVTSLFGGALDSRKNIPFDFVKEVQIKSAGYEAEFGGATGGVINAVTRSGSNDWHGEGRLEYSSDRFRANDNPTLRRKLTDITTSEYFFNPYGKDKTKLVNPVISLGGPVLKNKLWFFTSYAPELFRTERTTDLISVVTGAPAETVLGSRILTRTEKFDYFLGRVDYTPLKNLSVSGSFINSPNKANGNLLAQQITSSSQFTDPRHQFKGGFVPSKQGAVSATWTPTSSLVVSFRGGRNYLNDKGGNYDIPVNTPWPIITDPCPTNVFSNCASGTTSVGNPTIVTNSLTLFNITKRTNLNWDASYVKRLAGQQHVFKGGYQVNKLFNNVTNERSGGFFQFHFNRPEPETGIRGTYGYYDANTFGTEGKVKSTNQGIFAQDSWQVVSRLTLNLGVRFEHEFLPAFPINLSNHPSLSASDLEARPAKLVTFGWGDKVAPRLGAAFDVFGDGKLKIYGSYSRFFDTMKYDLPRASGGGEFWIQRYFTLEQPDFRGISLTNTPGREIKPLVDLRLPSIGEGDPPGIDPNLMPMREHEITVGADYAWSSKLLFSARLTRKELDVAIDDVGHSVVGVGEEYTVANPGFGIGKSFYQAPKAVREYTGLELRVDKRFSNNWYANLSYIHSKLFGNYGGLASSDENGRANPNINRYFDNLAMSFDNFGHEVLGRLATDRPNTFKGFGSYRLNWKRMQTDIGASQIAFQGIPRTTSISILIPGGAPFSVFPNGRGDLGRTPWLTQTDLIVNHRIKYDEHISFKFSINVLNVFDERNVIGVYTGAQDGRTNGLLISSASVSYASPQAYINGNGDIFTKIATQNLTKDPRFNKATDFQGPRTARISFGIEW